MKKESFTLTSLVVVTQIFPQTNYVPDDNYKQPLIDKDYDSGV